MAQSKFIGWICRTWTETFAGWESEFATFDTESEAIAHGISHNHNLRLGELSRDYEIYKNFDNSEWEI